MATFNFTVTGLSGQLPPPRVSGAYDYTIRLDADGNATVTQAAVPIRIEAEDFSDLEGYTVQTRTEASGGGVLALPGSEGEGDATATFTGEAGTYDIVVAYVEEPGGEANLRIAVDGEDKQHLALDQVAAEATNGTIRAVTLSGMTLEEGSEIQLRGISASGGAAAVDYIELVRTDTSGPIEVAFDVSDFIAAAGASTGEALARMAQLEEELADSATALSSVQDALSSLQETSGAELSAREVTITDLTEQLTGAQAALAALQAAGGGKVASTVDQLSDSIGTVLRRLEIINLGSVGTDRELRETRSQLDAVLGEMAAMQERLSFVVRIFGSGASRPGFGFAQAFGYPGIIPGGASEAYFAAQSIAAQNILGILQTGLTSNSEAQLLRNFV